MGKYIEEDDRDNETGSDFLKLDKLSKVSLHQSSNIETHSVSTLHLTNDLFSKMNKRGVLIRTSHFLFLRDKRKRLPAFALIIYSPV